MAVLDLLRASLKRMFSRIFTSTSLLKRCYGSAVGRMSAPRGRASQYEHRILLMRAGGLRGVCAGMVIAAVLLSGCAPAETAAEPKVAAVPAAPKVTVEEVGEGGNIEVALLGEVVAKQEARLTARVSGDIVEVAVKTGDRVAAGQVLVRLSSDSVRQQVASSAASQQSAQQSQVASKAVAEQAVANAKIAVQQAETSLSNLLAENAEKQKSAEEALAAAGISSTLSVASAKTALETAEKNLVSQKVSLSESEASYETAVDNAIRSMRTALDTALSDADEILGVSPTFKEAYEAVKENLGALDYQARDSARNQLAGLLNARSMTREGATAWIAYAKEVEAMLVQARRTVEYSVPAGSLTQTEITTYLSTVSSQLSAVRGSISTLATAEAALTNLRAGNAATLNNLTQAVEAAKKNLASAEQESSSGESQTVRTARAQYAATMAQLASSEKTLRLSVDAARAQQASAERQLSSTIASAASGVVSAQNAVNAAAVTADDLVITAPFAGSIAEVPAEVGDYASMGALLVRVQDEGALKVVLSVPQEYGALFAEGASVQFDGGGTGRVSAVAKQVDGVSRTMRVELAPEGSALTAGAFVRARASGKLFGRDEITVPLSAVIMEGEKAFVWCVGVDSTTFKKGVVLGDIRTDRVVVTGLVQGDRVIVAGGRMLKQEGVTVTLN